MSELPPDAAIGGESVAILLVDDDEHWAWATAQWLERREPFTVETADSLAAARSRFAAFDPDCVVCDYHLGDGTGLDLLGSVRERDEDRPFLLVTGKGDESVAGEAIRRGVDDYIPKGRDDADELLATRISNLVRATRSEQRFKREQRTKTAVLDVLRETASERELCGQFCRRLVETDAYALAWIGMTDGSDLVPTASAGREAYFDTVAGETSLPAMEPASKAADRTEPVSVSSITPGDDTEGWQHAASEAGFGSVVAVPIQYEAVTFGVLAVYLDSPVADEEQQSITEYAESIGYALQSLARKRSLLSPQPVSIEITVTDTAAPLVALSEAITDQPRIETNSVITRDDGTTLYLVRIDGAAPAAIESAIAGHTDMTLLDSPDTETTKQYAIAVSAPTPEGIVVDHGARFDRTVVDQAGATISVRVDEETPVSRLATALEQFSGTTVSTVWTDDQPTTHDDGAFDRLTDKQRRILRHAFHAGYFERPRGANATEIAAQLGISRQTFSQHLRAAQHKIFESWQTADS